MNRCLICNGELSTGDFNGVCSKCRDNLTPLTDVQDYVYINFEPYRNLLIKQSKKLKRRKIYERKVKRGIKWNTI